MLRGNTCEADRYLLAYIENIADESGVIVEISQGRQGRFRVTGLDADAYRFLMEEFVETDLHIGMTPAQQAQFRQMHRLATPTPQSPPAPEAPRRSLWERLEEDSV